MRLGVLVGKMMGENLLEKWEEAPKWGPEGAFELRGGTLLVTMAMGIHFLLLWGESEWQKGGNGGQYFLVDGTEGTYMN